MKLAISFFAISFLVVLLDLFMSNRSFAQKNHRGRLLGYTCLGAVVISVSYLISILPLPVFWVSFFSSVYFIFIDLTLWSCLYFVVDFTQERRTWFRKAEYIVLTAYLIFDCAVLAINPFWEIAVRYTYRGGLFARYAYEMLPLYRIHLGFSYVLILAILEHLFGKAVRAPGCYKNPYRLSIMGFLLIILINAVFLYFPDDTPLSCLDFSIWLYSLMELLFYWVCFIYPQRGMMTPLRSQILENISQGVVLFDYEDSLLFTTKRAGQMLPGIPLDNGTSLHRFIRSCGITMEKETEDQNQVQLCFLKNQGESKTLQCDYRPLFDRKNKLMGRLFVFSDVIAADDLLTGFHNWESFVTYGTENLKTPVVVAVCDINGLSGINQRFSHAEGDLAVRRLADAMKLHFPRDTYFARGMDARLIALCSGCEEETAVKYVDAVCSDGSLLIAEKEPIRIQGAVVTLREGQMDLRQAVAEAERSLKAKKLLDHSSSHSALMRSLTQALQETDNDTEAHVKRTRIMGENLGRRLGLTDGQLSDLSLLCVLHDIGKIGIPLEILNKPGKLTPDEWAVLQTHVYKGTEVARSTQELNRIADMILHHHERWDGKGYPDGLSKESIPLLSRIIAVVDAYDAMVNDRVYRKAITREEACGEIRRCAGTQFDPSIVAEFLRMMEEEVGPVPESVEAAEGEVIRPESRAVHETQQKYVHRIRYARYMLNEDDIVISADDEFYSMTGYTREDVEKGSLSQFRLIVPEDLDEYRSLVAEQLISSDMAYFEHRLIRKDGSVIYVFCLGRRYYDSARRAGQSEVIITDSSVSYSVSLILNEERNKAMNRLQFWEDKYRCDSLTGLLTHESFKNDVEERLLHGNDRVMMLMMDLDWFKQYNDTFGHREGDELLILVAQTLTGGLRKDDLACRMGGDEFAAALFFGQDVEEAVMQERARQLCDKVNMVLSNQQGEASLSMGVAISDSGLHSFNKLYEAADKAMYHAKDIGKARVVFDGTGGTAREAETESFK